MTGTHPWILVPYERLVRHGSQELQRITQALGLEMTTEMKESLPEPSSSVKDTLPDDRDRQLSKWERRLSSQQIDDILSVADSMGLSVIWTSDLEPNYDRLNDMQRSKYQWYEVAVRTLCGYAALVSSPLYPSCARRIELPIPIWAR